jgi:hypothetical protein
MRTRAIVIAGLLIMCLVAFGRKEESLQELVARAEAARPQDQAELFTEIAERQVASADQRYTEGKVEEAEADIKDVVKYSDKARDAAVATGKKLKHTEIAMRRMATKLRDIKRGLAFEDQAAPQAAIEHLENLRTELLSHMFGSKDKKEP